MDELKELVQELGEELNQKIKDKLAKRGHKNRGNLEKSFELKVTKTADGWEATGYASETINFVENRTPASRIPFSINGRSGKKTSKLIEGLVGYFKSKGFSAKKALGFAFGTATKWRQSGKFTKNSRRFSKDGKRGFSIRDSINEAEKEFTIKIEQKGSDIFQIRIDNLITDINKEI